MKKRINYLSMLRESIARYHQKHKKNYVNINEKFRKLLNLYILYCIIIFYYLFFYIDFIKKREYLRFQKLQRVQEHKTQKLST